MPRSVEIPMRLAGLIGLGLAGALVERVVDPYITPATTPVVLKAEEQDRPFSTFNFPSRTWMNLNSTTFNGETSFVKLMEEMGREVLPPNTFGPGPRRAFAN